MNAKHPTQKRCRLRILKSDREKLDRLIFQRYPAKEWGSFFRFGFRRTPWGLAASFVSTEPPKPGDLDRQSPLTVFRSRYILRAHHIVEDSNMAAGVIHSHPQGFDTFPSPSDDDMDDYYSKELERYGKGQPYMSIISARDRDGGFYLTGRVYDNGEWYPVTDLLTVGDELEHDFCQVRQQTSEAELDIAEEKQTAGAESFTARLEALLGKAASKRLSRSTVGVLGCSGTGSPAVHVLARAGVGRFILVDPQMLSHSNVERVHGSRFDDFRLDEPPAKVKSLARLIKENKSGR
jgi:hypothetical protein